MRALGVDPGEARVGLALSDALGLAARPLEVVATRDAKAVVARIETIVREQEVGTVVVGLPRNMDGTSGKEASAAERLADALSRRLPDVRVTTWDERLSSAQAERLMADAGLTRGQRAARRDKVAAQIILQSWLDHERRAAPHTDPDPPAPEA